MPLEEVVPGRASRPGETPPRMPVGRLPCKLLGLELGRELERIDVGRELQRIDVGRELERIEVGREVEVGREPGRTLGREEARVAPLCREGVLPRELERTPLEREPCDEERLALERVGDERLELRWALERERDDPPFERARERCEAAGSKLVRAAPGAAAGAGAAAGRLKPVRPRRRLVVRAIVSRRMVKLGRLATRGDSQALFRYAKRVPSATFRFPDREAAGEGPQGGFQRPRVRGCGRPTSPREDTRSASFPIPGSIRGASGERRARDPRFRNRFRAAG